ncbi:MAG TPA: outer membrane lipoprotein-sorting protein, partial [Nitrospirae bacterium]|nr:outer membrane lipoprotein-sorting protein [Nitrospirota bacterium]
MIRTVIFLIFTAIIFSSGWATAFADPAQEIDIKEIVDKVDRILRSDTSVSKMEMSIETPNWKRTLTMDMWTEGLDKTLIRVLGPAKDRGVATLRTGTEMWNFFPKINKVMKVPPSMMMSSWMGSDFTNDDLVKESSMTRDYDYRLIENPDTEHYYVELTPKADIPIVWGKIVITARKSDYIPIREEFYDEDGTKMRVMELKEIKPMGGRTVPTVIELIPLNKKNRKTTIRYLEAEFDAPLDKDVFTLR